MLSLAIVDDIGAILSWLSATWSHIAWGALALGALGIAIVRAMALLGFRGIPLYFLMAAWSGSLWMRSGIHARLRREYSG